MTHRDDIRQRKIDVKSIEQNCREGIGCEPREWQRESWRKLSEGRDTLVIAGTGSGKSLVFEALVWGNEEAIVLVISPLKALMQQQVDNDVGG